MQPGYAVANLAGQFLSVNDRFCDLIQRERSQIVGRTILELTVEDDRAVNTTKLKALREQNRPFEIHKSYLSGRGSLVPVRNLVDLITDGLGETRLVATINVVVPESPVDDLRLWVTTARELLKERRHRRSLFGDLLAENPRWDLLLTAFILEAEGRSARSLEVCKAAQVEEQRGILGLWALIADNYIETDGREASLRETGVVLSALGNHYLRQHLSRLR